MRINVAWAGCNRPEYSKESLCAILNTTGFNGKIFASVDLQSDGTANQDVINLLEKLNITYSVSKTKLGCNGNILNALLMAWEDKPDAVLMVEDDIILSKPAWAYFKWAARTFKNQTFIRTVTGWRHEEGWLPPAKLPENEVNRTALQSHFTCWSWLTWTDRWEEMMLNWTTGGDSHETSWDVVLSKSVGDRYEVCPAISMANNIGEKNGTHRGAAHPGALIDPFVGDAIPKFFLDRSATIHRKKTAFVILGRFGDILMVCRKLKRPSIIVCHKFFRSIVDELFPQHEVFEITSDGTQPIIAANYASSVLKGHTIVICQQHGMGADITQGFRSYQSQQEYMASNDL